MAKKATTAQIAKIEKEILELTQSKTNELERVTLKFDIKINSLKDKKRLMELSREK